MAQYFTDFSEYQPGVQPHDWTVRWVASMTAVVKEKDIARNGKVFEVTTDSTQVRRLVSWDKIDFDQNTDQVEVFFRARINTSGADIQIQALTRGGGAISTETGYRLGSAFSSNNIGKYVNGTYTELANPDALHASGTVLNTLAQSHGNTHRVKVWPEGSVEPVLWSAVATDPDISLAGWVGLFIFARSNVHDVDVFGVGTDNDPAPRSRLDESVLYQPQWWAESLATGIPTLSAPGVIDITATSARPQVTLTY